MHVTTKDSSIDGALHTLTSVLEADGAHELASVKARLSAKVVGVRRTPSGGIELEVAVRVAEPAPAPAEPGAKPEARAESEAPEPTFWGKALGKKQ